MTAAAAPAMLDHAQFASSQPDAAELLGMDLETWEMLRKHRDFPPRTKQGWDVAAIREWLATGPESALDQSPTNPDVQAEGTPPQFVTLSLTLCDPDPDSYIATMSGRINTRLERGDQLEAFKRLHAGLRAANAQLANGRPVDGIADVLRWICEQIQETE